MLSLPKETLQVGDKLTSDKKSVDCSQATAQSSRLIENEPKQLFKHCVMKHSFNQTLEVL